jgi:beta-xylosidase
MRIPFAPLPVQSLLIALLARAALAALPLFATHAAFAGDATPSAPWIPDRGDGTFRNPVLFADYSDPDAIRVGDDYYLVASSFAVAPALPILHSRDLVNWTLVNHALPRQVPAEFFAKSRHGQGVWAPAIRHHAGKFWIFYPDPDYGIYLLTADDPRGRWSDPVLVKAGRGLIDPCPFWDDDGRVYLIHGWARSRAGIANLLSLHELSADGTRLLDAGRHTRPGLDGSTLDVGDIVIDANQLPGWNTLEGPKLYKRHGWYYVFAPAGGVKPGYQAVFRSRSIRGPYETRIVLDQGSTVINGPHQGAWVDTPSGQDWFLHFQDREAFGRVVHLQPMVWRDDWPVIGADPDGDGKGEPLLVSRKPDTGSAQPVTAPATSDDFAAPALGLQWQWNANPQPAWADLATRRGFLRLACVPAPATRNDGSPATASIYDAPNFLLQKFPAPAFTATTVLDFAPAADGDTAGLVVFGYNYAMLGLRRADSGTRLVLRVNLGANQPGAQERELASIPAPAGPVYLRVTVDEQALCRFAYSFDNVSFTAVGAPFQATVDRWIGAKFGLIATATPDAPQPGHADFDWFRVTPPAPSPATP